MSEKFKIGIVGVGVVGGAVKNYFAKKGLSLFLYDKYKDIGSIAEVNKADVIFVCVPTPYVEGKGFGLSYVEDACKNLTGEKIVVIKSTVVPGCTEKLQKEFPQHSFMFNPEFLKEKTPDQDMQNPDRQIVGYTEKSKNLAEKILGILPEAPYKKIMPSAEAEMVKYFSNTFLTLKVIFANQMFDLCQKTGLDYNAVAQASSADPRIGKSHLEIFHNGYRGYGGTCFPKDIKTLIDFAKEHNVNLKLHEAAEEINNQLKL